MVGFSRLGKTIARQKDQAVVALGGSAPARTALDVLAETVAWWAADDASNVHDGGFFSQLTDLSGNGNHLVQATGSLQPARLDASGVISAEFDATDDVMICASPTAALMNNFDPPGGTSIEVTRADAGGFSRVWNKSDLEYVAVEETTGLLFNWSWDFTTTSERRRADVPQAVGARHITGVRWSKNILGFNAIDAEIDGVMYTPADDLNQYSTGDGTPTDLSGADLHLGNRIDGARCLDGGIYELAFWDNILSETDMALVRTHLATKYGVTLS